MLARSKNATTAKNDRNEKFLVLDGQRLLPLARQLDPHEICRKENTVTAQLDHAHESNNDIRKHVASVGVNANAP